MFEEWAVVFIARLVVSCELLAAEDCLDVIEDDETDVYVDGNQVASRTGDRGQVNTMIVDISNGKSLAVEVFCARATNCQSFTPYYFMKAQIEPGARSPGRR
ncbi:MAG: hypothetical protein ACM65K_24435 [Microcoleus sp.]